MIFFYSKIIGDATSDFLFDHHFKLNSSETTENTNSKLSNIDLCTKLRVLRKLVTPW